MSESVFLESSNTFANKLLNLEFEMNLKSNRDNKSVDEILKTYFDILSLYEKSLILPLNENDKTKLQERKEDIYLELKMFKLDLEMKEQFYAIPV